MNNNLGNKETMAHNIKLQLEQHGYNSKDLAVKLGVSQATVSGWITGRYYPRINRIEQMANLFNISKADLVERAADQFATQLLFGGIDPPSFSDEELSLMLLYRKASDLDKDIIRKLLSKYEEIREEPETEDTAFTHVS